MSGGFFRGTSADQDTRFSNKQAKLMKSQKFAPELENLVDMTKVKMDVMRPWIATRVTELIGFEDEVLINFIYTLLEEKIVNGKQLQISLTGFMERNTGKFMKELWALLLSAQQNASGVPQQFLDAKEEETKKKKAETDRVANEIRMKREKDKQDLYQEKTKMDGNGEMLRERHSVSELNEKHDHAQPTVDKERPKRNGTRGRSRVSRSSGSASRSPSPRKRRSRSISASPKSRSRSISSERQRRSSPRSLTPRRRHSGGRSFSPPRRRSPYSRKRSTSRTRHRSPSPTRYRVRSTWRYRSRSPLRHRSRSPRRRRSRSPVRRRSPSAIRDHSASPLRRRSPPAVRRRSPSPYGRGLPSERRRSPVPTKRRQSPSNSPKLSTSPVRRRSSINDRDKSLTPVPVRSPSDASFSSPSPTRRRSISPIRRGSPRRITRSPLQSPGRKSRSHIEYSSARRASPIERTERLPKSRNALQSVESKSVVSLRSPQRDSLDQNDLGGKGRHLLSSIEKSKSVSDASRGRRHTGDRSPRGSPYARREGMIHHESLSSLPKADGSKPRSDSSGTRVDDRDNISRREIGEPKFSSLGKVSPSSVRRNDSLDSTEIRGLTDEQKSRKTEPAMSDKQPNRVDHKEHRERQKLSTIHEAAVVSKKGREPSDCDRVNDKNRARDDKKGCSGFPEQESLPKTSKNSKQNGSVDSTPNRSDDNRIEVKEKRKDRKLDRQEADSDGYSSSDSYEERREAKKRRKEGKKLKKEERRRRREERRRRKEERRSEKQKLKSVDAGSSSSDYEQDHSEDDGVRRRDSRSKNQDTESQQKKLEIELREKALKSLHAKRGIGN